jgi:hypothetical protein
MSMFIYEREGWPTFRWSDEALSASLRLFGIGRDG